MANKAGFHPYGITIPTPDGDIILNAGNNMTIQPQGNFITFAAEFPGGAVINNVNPWQPPTLSDANAPNNSVYFSSDAGKLVYKGNDAVIHDLY